MSDQSDTPDTNVAGRPAPEVCPDGLVTGMRPQTFDHGPRSAFNAWVFRALDPYFNYTLTRHKNGAFAGLAPGTVVELGAGAGANLDRLPTGTHLIAVEPNERMHAGLRQRASERGVRMTLVSGVAEALPLPDGSVDDVVCTLVLCTVPDLEQTLNEVRRVLRPGGRFRFVEHVVAPARSPRQWMQQALRKPWGWLFEGCDPARDTVARLVPVSWCSQLLDSPRR
ncbi:class I SAM-dependent methyltransferase [Arthrobacter antioxidans]|uniref:class I SAM-dependent methyltransferase n=1 Tax=Arthrobacter antioxidans TaxID=2895818 RepID=UPI001FFFE3B3|nr:class I SAM-dependent methyltransferase [Arthrobacter antioxidans]